MPADERVYGPWGYRAWGYGLPCVVVGCLTRDSRPGSVQTIECCHVRTDGTSRKGGWYGNTFFSCWRHHREQGDAGLHTFAARHTLAVGGTPVASLEEAARETARQWTLREEGLAR